MKRTAAIRLAIATSVFMLGLQTASAQLIAGNDSTTGQLWVIDLAIPANTRSLVGTPATDFQIHAIAADNVNGNLYWIDSGNRLLRAPIVSSGTLTQTFIGTLTVSATPSNFNSLAWDSTDSILVAYRNTGSALTEGFYSVNTTTAECTLLALSPATTDDFGGLDYDPVTDAYYGANDSTVVANRGLTRINKPWSALTFTLLSAYPAGDTDIDGTAFGGGRAILVNDIASQGAFPYNLLTNAFEATIALPYTTNSSNAGGAWAPGMIPALTGADVSVTLTDAPDPIVVPPGGNITYTITVTNHGPDAAAGVTVTDVLPANVSFVSVDPPGMHESGTITANIGAMTIGQVVPFNLIVTPNELATISNTASVTSSTSDPVTGNDSATAMTTVRAPQADLAAVITAPGGCSLGAGGMAPYSFDLTNTGPETAENTQLVVTFPANVSFVSSIPPLVSVGNTLTLNPGTLGVNATATLNANFMVSGGSSIAMSAAASGTTNDPNAANNTTNHAMALTLTAPTAAPIKALLSSVPSSPTSDVPGLGGAKFVGESFSRPFVSPDGTRWILEADTDLPASIDEVIVAGTIGGTFGVIVQEGVTVLAESDVVGTINAGTGINDAGQFCFTAATNAAASMDEVVVKWDGNAFVTVAREGNSCPAIGGGVTWGATLDGATIQSDGRVSFYAALANTGGTANDTGYFTDDGNTVLAREGTTVPTNQGNGTTFPYDIFQTGSTEAVGLYLNASGSTFCGVIDIVTAPLAEDRTLVVDNDIKIQEGFTLPGSGYASVVASNSPLMDAMMADGTWFSYGSNADGQDWVVRNGAVIAQTGDEIAPGAGLFWGDTSYAQTFFIGVGNNNGDYVVGGVFNGATAWTDSNAGLVLNGSTIIARENDPVDLDANGMFDDGYYIRIFHDDRVFMTNEAVYILVSLRDEAEALCALGTPNTDQGSALIRIPLPVAPANPGDVNCDTRVDGRDIAAFAAALLDPAGYPTAYPGCNILNADTNNSGMADNADIPSFITLLVGP